MALELKGKRFGRLTVIERVAVRNARNAMWRCLCACGNETIAAATNIGKTTNSCGCIAKESAKELLIGNTYRRTHLSSGVVEYQAWAKMKQRCYSETDPKYPNYGARGIVVCDRWLDSFENFFTDMGTKPSPKHSIDRKDVNGNYEPNNCHWATAIQQMRNTTRNHFVTIDGQTKCVSEWAEFFGVPSWTPKNMIRGRGRKRNLPPKYRTIEEALIVLYQEHLQTRSAAPAGPAASM